MKSGIYKIINKINGTFYVGSSGNIRQRFANHKSSLRRNCHRNVYLQRGWNKYGEENFEFVVVLFCELNALLQTEQSFLDGLKGVRHYNLNYGAERSIHSPETLRKMSLSGKGKRLGVLNGQFKTVEEDVFLEAKDVWCAGGQELLFKFLKKKNFGRGVVRRLIKLFQQDEEAVKIRNQNKSDIQRKFLAARPRIKRGIFNPRKYRFVHISGQREHSTVADLRAKYSLKDGIYNVIKQTQKVAYGWRLENKCPLLPKT